MLEDILLSTTRGMDMDHVAGATLRRVQVRAEDGPAFELKHVGSLIIDDANK